ncbi:hypothetical protein Hore_03650 [Halothermothrix orenii H 168]|uniref:Uncharacterized protein n=1 Tax=Halothermothrix orenii (strain H 168 / OCM 544 / DSM 9562) TaxID=373903 RepID=B8D1P9_HALOH|nr:hypothetical protein Hore_03650 [Halothermothrix orenii H 168]
MDKKCVSTGAPTKLPKKEIIPIKTPKAADKNINSFIYEPKLIK